MLDARRRRRRSLAHLDHRPQTRMIDYDAFARPSQKASATIATPTPARPPPPRASATQPRHRVVVARASSSSISHLDRPLRMGHLHSTAALLDNATPLTAANHATHQPALAHRSPLSPSSARHTLPVRRLPLAARTWLLCQSLATQHASQRPAPTRCNAAHMRQPPTYPPSATQRPRYPHPTTSTHSTTPNTTATLCLDVAVAHHHPHDSANMASIATEVVNKELVLPAVAAAVPLPHDDDNLPSGWCVLPSSGDAS